MTLVGGDSVGFNIAFAAFGLDKQMLRLGTLIEENTLAGIGAAGSSRLYASMGYFANIESSSAKAFGNRYKQKFGADAPVLNGLGQSVYDGLMLLAALGNRAGSLDVSAINRIANGTSFRSPRGEAVVSGNHVDQTIYLADGAGGNFRVVKEFADGLWHGLPMTDSLLLIGLNAAWQITAWRLPRWGWRLFLACCGCSIWRMESFSCWGLMPRFWLPSWDGRG